MGEDGGGGDNRGGGLVGEPVAVVAEGFEARRCRRHGRACVGSSGGRRWRLG